MPPPLIEFENVHVARGGNLALQGVTLSIEPGEHVAILGPNGSGKSTLIQAITRDCYPLTGPSSRLRIFGRDTWNVFDLRALLGIVTNDLAERCVQPNTVEETVLSGFFSSIGVWPNHGVTAAMRDKASSLMDLLGIAHLSSRRMTEMSSGEVRRAVIARALVHDPAALLLDEPANSLDIASQFELRQAMRRLAGEGIGLVLVTHHLPDIVPEIGRVVCLRQGRVWRDGNKRELLTRPVLSKLFGVAVQLQQLDGYYHMY
ncbi:MAG TPA: ATP-binding cassette domain-containing protein [Bryobacteraceae bacterium]|nr:ATP-binding cassette domain-containing protein [Bryobacteraceae bacterium]